MASSNPFRKSFAPVESRGRPGADGVGKENQGWGLGFDGGSGDDVAKKKKSVKKVRVVSPPPRSPGPREILASPPPPAHPPPTWGEAELQAPGDAFPEGMGPRGGGQGLGSPILMHPRPQAQTRIQWPVLAETQNSPTAAGSQEDLETPVSANPFSKALHELGTGAGAEKADKPAAARRSLNVDSFRRLLMTGAASPSHSPPALDAPASSASSVAGDRSQSQNTRSDSGTGSSATAGADGLANGLQYHEPEASPAAAQPSREKKLPPPPPSSRHGRSLKADIKDPSLGATPSHELLPPSSIPIEQTHSQPSMLHGSSSGGDNSSSSSPSNDHDDDDDNDSLSNDPIIKALELELNGSATAEQELPNPLASAAAPNSAKKPVPAPPPRRGHARTESKARGIQAALSPQHSDPPSRNSMDSERSGAGSIRQSTAAPLPPPPRRPPIAPRQPSATRLSNPSSPNGPQNDHEYYTTAPEPSIALGKQGARPPPPPARQSSTARRPPGLLGVDPSSRRVSSDSKLRESMAPPPPPPPPSRHRERESSQPRSSAEMAPADLPGAADTRIRSSSSPTPNAGKSNDILADLDALQREVDALRGRIG